MKKYISAVIRQKCFFRQDQNLNQDNVIPLTSPYRIFGWAALTLALALSALPARAGSPTTNTWKGCQYRCEVKEHGRAHSQKSGSWCKCVINGVLREFGNND